MFQNVPSGLYSLHVTATADMDEEEVIWKVYVPITSSVCSVNPINAGLVVDGTSVSMEFRGVGSTSGFTCRLDNGRFSSCELCTVGSLLFMNHDLNGTCIVLMKSYTGTSPLSYSGLTPGQHRIRILAQGCQQTQGQTFRFTV